MYGITGYGAFYVANAPRNVRGPAKPFKTHYEWPWYGDVCPETVIKSCTDDEAFLLDSGRYQIRYSALKHFGNINNAADYDVYYSPPFDLVY